MNSDGSMGSVEAGEATVVHQSKWPKGWGITCIVWAGLMICLDCCMVLGLAFQGIGAGQSGANNPMPGIVKMQLALDVLVTIILVTVLMMGALKLLRRQRAARNLLYAFIVLRLLYAPVQVGLSAAAAKPSAEWNRVNMDNAVTEMEKGGRSAPQFMKDMAKNTDPQPLWLPVLFAAIPCIFPIVLGLVVSSKKDEINQWT